MEVKGQAFIMMSLIFASLLVLLTIALAVQNPQLESAGIEDFHGNSLEKTSGVVNNGLEKGSIKDVRKELYSFNSLIKRESQLRDADYRSVNAVMIPERGELLVINYQQQSEDISVDVNNGEWEIEEETLGAEEYLIRRDLPQDELEVEILLEDTSILESFEASSPRLFTHMRMEFGDEIWIDSISR